MTMALRCAYLWNLSSSQDTIRFLTIHVKCAFFLLLFPLFLCPYIKVYISQPSPPSQLLPLFVLTLPDISHMLHFDWHILTTCRQPPDPKPWTPVLGLSALKPGKRVQSTQQQQMVLTLTLSCTPLCNQNITFDWAQLVKPFLSSKWFNFSCI